VEGDEREQEEMGLTRSEGPMQFVYAATLLLFLGLTVFGFRHLHAGKDRAGIVMALLIFALCSLMNLLTAVQGTIQTDGRVFEDSVYGWFGQWSVLVAYTDLWLGLCCLLFAGGLGAVHCRDARVARRRADAVPAEAADAARLEMGYRAAGDAPSIVTEKRGREDPITAERRGHCA